MTMTPIARRALPLGVLAAAAGAGALATSPPASALKLTECQHPLVTGVEVYHLSHVGTATACRVALSLFRWEAKPGNIPKLYGCTSHPGRPFLRLRRFEGWSLHIARPGDFVMSRGSSSFDVTGTDFPLNCT
jgi:hypothetical protein